MQGATMNFLGGMENWHLAFIAEKKRGALLSGQPSYINQE
jgi:hypothetical protein